MKKFLFVDEKSHKTFSFDGECHDVDGAIMVIKNNRSALIEFVNYFGKASVEVRDEDNYLLYYGDFKHNAFINKTEVTLSQVVFTKKTEIR